MGSYEPEDEYPLIDWAEDRDVVADPACTTCWGEGADADGRACPCLVRAVLAAFPEAAAEAEPALYCPRCDGDGEDFDGDVCLCLVADLRRRHERLEAAAGV